MLLAWALCVAPEIRQDVQERMSGEHREAIEGVIKKLHLPPCPNPGKAPDGTPVSEMSPGT